MLIEMGYWCEDIYGMNSVQEVEELLNECGKQETDEDVMNKISELLTYMKSNQKSLNTKRK